MHALQAFSSHETGDPLAPAADPLVPQRPVDPRRSVGLARLGVDVGDQHREAGVADGSGGRLAPDAFIDRASAHPEDLVP